MQPIQDKDFDQLFKDTFADAEVAPSRDLWSSIESEIEPKRTRKLPVYWFAAAAVLVIATVGILINRQQGINEPNKNLASNMEQARPAAQVNSVKDSVAIITPVVEKFKITLPASAKTVMSLSKNLVKKEVKPEEQQKIITAAEAQKQEVMIAAQPDKPVQDLKSKIDDVILNPKEEVVLASNPSSVKVDEVIGGTEQVQSKGIRNMGDVVNLIVNKVDKRKDKFIQFRTDEDDDSSISSINIGPFKIGKKNKK